VGRTASAGLRRARCRRARWIATRASARPSAERGGGRQAGDACCSVRWVSGGVLRGRAGQLGVLWGCHGCNLKARARARARAPSGGWRAAACFWAGQRGFARTGQAGLEWAAHPTATAICPGRPCWHSGFESRLKLSTHIRCWQLEMQPTQPAPRPPHPRPPHLRRFRVLPCLPGSFLDRPLLLLLPPLELGSQLRRRIGRRLVACAAAAVGAGGDGGRLVLLCFEGGVALLQDTLRFRKSDSKFKRGVRGVR
jgi:hypothetical protein